MVSEKVTITQPPATVPPKPTGLFKEIFDVVVLFNLIEHVHNPKRTLSLIYNSLSSDGIAIIKTPNSTSFNRFLFKKFYWGGFHAPRHWVIFNEKNLIYIGNIHIGGDHITQDISKVLNIDYRKAEAEKLKFSKKNKINDPLKEKKLLGKIINSRLEEIVELLFLECPLIKENNFNNNLKLNFFIKLVF